MAERAAYRAVLAIDSRVGVQVPTGRESVGYWGNVADVDDHGIALTEVVRYDQSSAYAVTFAYPQGDLYVPWDAVQALWGYGATEPKAETVTANVTANVAVPPPVEGTLTRE